MVTLNSICLKRYWPHKNTCPYHVRFHAQSAFVDVLIACRKQQSLHMNHHFWSRVTTSSDLLSHSLTVTSKNDSSKQSGRSSYSTFNFFHLHERCRTFVKNWIYAILQSHISVGSFLFWILPRIFRSQKATTLFSLLLQRPKSRYSLCILCLLYGIRIFISRSKDVAKLRKIFAPKSLCIQ